MTRTTRTTARTAAGALAFAVALGVASPVATAAPLDGHGKSAHQTQKSSAQKSSAKSDKAEQGKRKVLLAIGKLDARLKRVARESRLGQLGAAEKDAVLANISADREALSELAAAVMEGTTGDLDALRKDLRDVRPQNYEQVVNDLRHVAKLAERLTEAGAAFEGDAAAPVEDLAAAQAALDAVLVEAALVTAFTGRDELRAVKDALSAAKDALDVVRDQLEDSSDEDSDDDSGEDDEDEGDEDEGDEGEDEPVVEEPVVTP